MQSVIQVFVKSSSENTHKECNNPNIQIIKGDEIRDRSGRDKENKYNVERTH